MAAAQIIPCPPDDEETLAKVTQRLAREGLQAVRSFELQTTDASCGNNSCPCSGAGPCQCRLTVFLIYGSNCPPLTMLAHRRGQQTWFSLVDTPQQPANPELEALVTAVLAKGDSAQTQPPA
jgi:hypothetical protein